MKRSLIPWRRESSETAVARREENPFAELHRQVNKLFEDFFGDFERSWGLAWPSSFTRLDTFAPRVDVSETEKELTVVADLPGLDEKDIQVSLDDDLLTIRGVRKDEREEKKRNYHLVERSYGEFHRSIPLPSGLDKDHAKATFKKGVLTVTLPKLPEAQSKRKTIAVESE
ncbi:MAG: Hsp20/alpha crystallin family protein [Kiritimatiellae bacterium]|nr:Hsp20/alpha crystallin family protein [Kiritimatiellia bacterium]MDW8458850.1 Hsp20/alpha crystallin family protein [Verrucomicrobiota bacterium]